MMVRPSVYFARDQAGEPPAQIRYEGTLQLYQEYTAPASLDTAAPSENDRRALFPSGRSHMLRPYLKGIERWCDEGYQFCSRSSWRCY